MTEEGQQEAAGRGRPKRAELDDAILEAACDVLATHGYRGFSFDAVAKAAGTTRPAIYRRWDRREDLLLATLDYAMRVHSADEDVARILSGATDAAVRDLLEKMLVSFTEMVGDPKVSAVSISVSAAMYEDPELRALAQAHHYDRRRPLEIVMRIARDRGLLRQDVPVDDLIHIFVGAIQYRSNMLLETVTPRYAANILKVLLASA
jgi:AcrR family transcriptional regulator